MSQQHETSKYSVLMSVYKNDNPHFLRLAIDSMLHQTVPPEQFVIVEDGPVNDKTESIITDYAKRFPELFTVVRLKKNGGLGNALNQGLKVCRNELVARMDADDISCPERCEKQLKRFCQKSKLTILGTQIKEFINETSNVVSSRPVPCSYKEIRKFGRRRSPFNHPTVMFKKSAILRLGGYVAYGRKEDLDLFIRAINNNCYSENLSESLLYYRTSEDNLKRRKTWINCKEYIQIMMGFYKKRYIGFNDLTYVIIGQLLMFITPTFITQKLSDCFLRSNE